MQRLVYFSLYSYCQFNLCFAGLTRPYNEPCVVIPNGFLHVDSVSLVLGQCTYYTAKRWNDVKHNNWIPFIFIFTLSHWKNIRQEASQLMAASAAWPAWPWPGWSLRTRWTHPGRCCSCHRGSGKDSQRPQFPNKLSSSNSSQGWYFGYHSRWHQGYDHIYFVLHSTPSVRN